MWQVWHLPWWPSGIFAAVLAGVLASWMFTSSCRLVDAAVQPRLSMVQSVHSAALNSSNVYITES